MSEQPLTFDRFSNALRILNSIDGDHFRAAIGRPDDIEAWRKYRRDPADWFIRAPYEQARGLWALVEARQP